MHLHYYDLPRCVLVGAAWMLRAELSIQHTTSMMLMHKHLLHWHVCVCSQEYYKSRSGFAERQQLHQLLMFKGHYLEAGTMAVQVTDMFMYLQNDRTSESRIVTRDRTACKL
jgi:hypothetical protein